MSTGNAAPSPTPAQETKTAPTIDAKPMPKRRANVSWAPGCVSPAPSRERLHKKARVLSDATVDTRAEVSSQVQTQQTHQRTTRASRRSSEWQQHADVDEGGARGGLDNGGRQGAVSDTGQSNKSL